MLKRITLLIILAASSFMFLFLPASAAAQGANGQVFGACNNGNVDSSVKNSSVCQNKNTTNDPVVKTINTAANVIAVLTGIIAVIMIIISGLAYAGSGGSSEAAANARKRLTYSIVGLVIVALAWTITRFVTDKVVQ